MRMHTDTLSIGDVREIAHETLPRTVQLDITQHGSRKRTRGFELHLNAAGGRDRRGQSRRYANSGSYGANTYTMAATWHEWGDFIAGIFRRDQEAVVGDYDNVVKFLEDTARFDPLQRDTPIHDRVSPWLEEVEPV